MKMIFCVYRVCVDYVDIKCNRNCLLSPKKSCFKQHTRLSHCLEAFLLVLSSQERVPENSLRGSHLFGWLSLPCLVSQRIFLRTRCVGPIGFCGSLYLVMLISKNFDLTTHITRCADGATTDGWDGIGVYTSKFFRRKISFFNFLFFLCL